MLSGCADKKGRYYREKVPPFFASGQSVIKWCPVLYFSPDLVTKNPEQGNYNIESGKKSHQRSEDCENNETDIHNVNTPSFCLISIVLFCLLSHDFQTTRQKLRLRQLRQLKNQIKYILTQKNACLSVFLRTKTDRLSKRYFFRYNWLKGKVSCVFCHPGGAYTPR